MTSGDSGQSGSAQGNPTMASLASRISRLSPAQKAAFLQRLAEKKARQESGKPTIERRVEASGQYPLSFAQERIWFIEQLNPGSDLYNTHSLYSIREALDLSVLSRSFQVLVARHGVLRTGFDSVAGEPHQRLATLGVLAMPVIDLSGLESDRRRAEAYRLSDAAIQQPFDLRRPPLMRTLLLRLTAEEYLQVLVVHHLICDGWSWAIFCRELWQVYVALLARRTPELDEIPLRYVDYVQWERQRYREGALARQLEYWKQRLAGADALLKLPTDRPRLPMQSFRGATRTLYLPKKVSAALHEQQEFTLFIQLMAAFHVLLRRLTGQKDLCCGSVIASRSHPQTSGLLGCLINTLVLRVDQGEDPTFYEVLEESRRVTLEAFENQEIPFEKLVEEIQPERSLSHAPLFQVAVGQNPVVGIELPIRGGLEAYGRGRNVNFDLSLEIGNLEAGRQGLYFGYSTDLFDAVTIERFLSHYLTLLQAALASPRCRLSELPMLTRAERHLLWVEHNDTMVAGESASILPLIERRAAEYGSKIALVCGADHWTYGELDASSNRIAH